MKGGGGAGGQRIARQAKRVGLVGCRVVVWRELNGERVEGDKR